MTLRRIISIGLALLLAVFVVVVVGLQFLPDAPSPWEFGWEALVAVGTILLALATFSLALATRRTSEETAGLVASTEKLAEATARTADIDASALGASTRPLIAECKEVPVVAGFENEWKQEPVSFHEVGEPQSIPLRSGALFVQRGGKNNGAIVLVAVPIRNVGRGSAVISDPGPRLLSEGLANWQGGRCDRRVVPPDETGWLVFALSSGLTDRATVEVRYSDVSGGQVQRTWLLLENQHGKAWRVGGFALGDDHPESGPVLAIVAGAWTDDERARLLV